MLFFRFLTDMTKPVFVLYGPNLNMLGKREPEIYGTTTLDDIEQRLHEKSRLMGMSVDFRQSSSEGRLVDWILEARDEASAIILNAGAYTHTSVALFDALMAAQKPGIEVHLSNVFRREAFRHHSYVSPGVNGVICGFGPLVYELALDALAKMLGEL